MTVMKPERALRFAEYRSYDSDGAGTRAALRAMPILRDAGITAKIIRMEPYKDPDEFIKNLGAEAFEERIASARNVFMYSLEVLEKDYDMNSPEGKTEFMKETARRLTQFEEEIRRKGFRYVVPDFRLNKAFDKLNTLSQSENDKVEFLCNECCWFGCRGILSC